MAATIKQTFGLAARVLWMRLRFVLAVAGLFAVIALWNQLGALWDRAVVWLSGEALTERGVSPDTEYFCPMCPGVLAAWPEKCPVCKMPLVRRTRGESQLLPEGVTARMQISPYRVQLAGIKTSPVGYLPLAHEFRTRGTLREKDLVAAPISPWDVPYAAAGAPVELRSDRLPAGTSLAGTIKSVAAADGAGQSHELQIRVSDAPQQLASGASLDVIARVPLASIEPYRSQPRELPPLTDGAPRSYFVCPDHPGWIRAGGGKCPFDDRPLEERRLRDDQRLEWSCRWHAGEHHSETGTSCPHCQRPCNSPRVVTYVPPGEVLVVPESAVIDTGSKKIVFVETMPGMFDGVLVELGAKEGGYLPVLSGLSPGQRVASAGAFLLDAETRLNPSLAASYFGAGSAAGSGSSAVIAAASSAAGQTPDLLGALNLPPDDLLLARRQKVCPITRMALGAMGPLIRVEVEGEPVFLCCAACKSRVRQSGNGSTAEPIVP
ncbi:MAG TPA: heavy metal-binding domain-containing protein [Pirellulaceae bacterium]|nr:heavy metal-binding domain-containing protein [Pirellulaceae bacterium]